VKDWFPFTSYDFYAYLTAGMVTLAAVDRVYLRSMLASEAHWTIVNGAFWTAIAYLIGQIIAIPSSAILEHLVARKFLRDPSTILLGLEAPRRREVAVRWLIGAREYEPLPVPTQASVIRKVAAVLSIPVADVKAEVAFHCAFPHGRGVADSATRLDNFMNQYGMCRNVSFAAVIAGVLMIWRASHTRDRLDWILVISAFMLAIGLFGRFMKFYAAYAREIFRTFDKVAAVTGLPVTPPAPPVQ
jgi:hypothetical protein